MDLWEWPLVGDAIHISDLGWDGCGCLLLAVGWLVVVLVGTRGFGCLHRGGLDVVRCLGAGLWVWVLVWVVVLGSGCCDVLVRCGCVLVVVVVVGCVVRILVLAVFLVGVISCWWLLVMLVIVLVLWY